MNKENDDERGGWRREWERICAEKENKSCKQCKGKTNKQFSGRTVPSAIEKSEKSARDKANQEERQSDLCSKTCQPEIKQIKTSADPESEIEESCEGKRRKRKMERKMKKFEAWSSCC